MKPDQERVHALLVDTVTLLCKNGLNFRKGLKVEGVLGITVDEKDVFIVHIDELLQSETSEKVQPSREDVEVSLEALPGKDGSQETPPRKRRRNRSGSPLKNKPIEVDKESEAANEQCFSDLTPDGRCSYLNAEGLNSAEYSEETLKAEKLDDEVIFVKTEDPKAQKLDDPAAMGVVSIYHGQSIDSLTMGKSQLSSSGPQATTSKGIVRNLRASETVPRSQTSAVSQLSYHSADVLTNSASNSTGDMTFKYENEEDPSPSVECDAASNSLSFAHWTSSSYTTSGMNPGTLGFKHNRYQQNRGIRNSMSTAASLPRRSSDNLWQVVSRFICNFPSCTLSFSTKQNLLRHQTQKHGRQKSRIVGQTRKFVKPMAMLCDSV